MIMAGGMFFIAIVILAIFAEWMEWRKFDK